MKTAKISVALAIVVFLFIFSINNSQPVEIAFLSYRSPGLPLFLLIIFMFLLGGLLAGLLAAIRLSQLHRRNQLLKREIETLSNNQGTLPTHTSEGLS